MNLTLPRTILPLALGLVLLGAAALVSRNDTRVPDTSAVVQIWGDLVRDFDSVGLAVTRVSAGDEKRIGDDIARDVGRYERISDDGRLAAYVEGVGKAVLEAAGRPRFPYSFSVIASGGINAFAIPGGHVYVTTGLLDEIRSEAELAYIIGHEISHIALRHCIGRLQYELLARRIGGDALGAIVRIGHELIATSYDAEQETDADLNGLLLAAKAGYDPRAAVGALGILARLEAGDQEARPRTATGEVVGGVGGILTDLARSHPQAMQRIANVEAMIARNASSWEGKRFYVGVRNHSEKAAFSLTDHGDEWIVFNR